MVQYFDLKWDKKQEVVLSELPSRSLLVLMLYNLHAHDNHVPACRYDSHLAAAGKQGALKGLAVGLSISSVYFLNFFIYAISFW